MVLPADKTYTSAKLSDVLQISLNADGSLKVIHKPSGSYLEIHNNGDVDLHPSGNLRLAQEKYLLLSRTGTEVEADTSNLQAIRSGDEDRYNQVVEHLPHLRVRAEEAWRAYREASQLI